MRKNQTTHPIKPVWHLKSKLPFEKMEVILSGKTGIPSSCFAEKEPWDLKNGLNYDDSKPAAISDFS